MTEFHIEKQHFCGDGIAISDGRPIRIANALTGETVIAEDVSIRRRRQAYLTQVTESSPLRCPPVCTQWQRCPACQYQCMRTESQRELKKTQWLSLIRKFVDIPGDCTIEFHPAPRTLEYRCRIDAEVYRDNHGAHLGIAPRLDAAVTDLHAHGFPPSEVSSLEPAEVMELPAIDPVPVAGCPLHAPELNSLIERVEPLLTRFPLGTRLSLEAYRNSARITAYAKAESTLQTREAAQNLAKQASIAVVFQQLPPRGSHVYPKPEFLSGSQYHCYAHNELGQPLMALPGAWTPVNPDNAKLIRRSFIRMVQGRSFHHVLELGCGCGTHSTVFARCATRYTGIDIAWPAILSAQHNAQSYMWENSSFFTDSADHYLDKRYYKGVRADAIVMHSNRLPYGEKTAQLILRFGAKDIMIAAPTAFAMAQECRHLCALGYHLNHLSLCDTLPLTYHMMATAHLSLLH